MIFAPPCYPINSPASKRLRDNISFSSPMTLPAAMTSLCIASDHDREGSPPNRLADGMTEGINNYDDFLAG